jgi:hypothetical protein
VFFNRFLDGYPYLCRAVDLSSSALLIETFSEPETRAERFALELRFPGDDDSLWLWARRLWRRGEREALEFVSLSCAARNRIERYLGAAAQQASSV